MLRFLAAVGDELQVDPAVVTRARNYLLSRQKKSGAWTKMTWPQGRELEDAYMTSEVARSLALTMPGPKDADRERLEASLNSSMTYLDLQAWPDAYVAGNYAIAAIATGNKQRIKKARENLAQLAHPEGSATYWNLEANMSPFYGWGDPGRVESTAIAVEALAMVPADNDSSVQEQMERGVQFLLSHKDPYRVWYSTHASQAAVEALATAVPAGNNQGGVSKADVVVNGHKAGSVDLPAARDIVGAIAVDLDKYLITGRNSIQVLRPENGTPMNTQAVTSYYLSWSDSSATHGENIQRGDTRALRLNVHYSQTEPKVDEPVTCNIEVERIGFEGYGMMIAEIGLPPGVDVDRQSLQDSGPRYEVHPDRVVFYLWPAALGTRFSFKFRTRYRMNANTSPSTLYDYYNPEANATVAPVKFDVH